MHDGRNLWDDPGAPFGGWKIETTADRLIAAGKMQPIIIVGIDNTPDRSRELVGYALYYGARTEDTAEEVERAERVNRDYMRFVVATVKPLIDGRYRTLAERDYTGIAGSSFGAGVSLLLAMEYPETYSRVGALSGGNPSPQDPEWATLPFAIYPFIMENKLLDEPIHRIYLDCGTLGIDAPFLPFTTRMRRALVERGWREDETLKYEIVDGADHNEAAWADRVDRMLTFLFRPD
jgi:enterochelin esterase-like enzyme